MILVMAQPRRSWLLGLVVGVVAVAGLAVWLSRPEVPGPRAESTDSSREGWQRLSYDDIRVDVPQSWAFQKSDDCLADVEHWGPPTAATCGERAGVTFQDSSLYDPGAEPGTVVSVQVAGVQSWSGYVIVGGVVVSVTGEDRAIVTEVLESADAPGFQPIG
ncbi:hypothetical protein [Nocardioides marinquilinus]